MVDTAVFQGFVNSIFLFLFSFDERGISIFEVMPYYVGNALFCLALASRHEFGVSKLIVLGPKDISVFHCAANCCQRLLQSL